MNRFSLLAAFVLAAGVGWASAACAAAARTPTQLAAGLLAAAKRGDEQALLALLTPEAAAALQASAPGHFSLSAVQRPFNRALDAQFGRGAPMASAQTVWPSRARDLIAVLARIDNLAVIGVGRESEGQVPIEVRASYRDAKAKIQTAEGVLLAEQDKTGWKLALPAASDPIGATARGEEEGMIGAEVERGVYKNRTAAMIALSNLWAKDAAK